MGLIGRKIVLPDYGGKNQYVEISIIAGNPHDRYPEISEKWNDGEWPKLDNYKENDHSCGMVYNVIDNYAGLGTAVDQHVGHSHVGGGVTIGQVLTEQGLQTEWEYNGFNSEDEFLISKVK